MITTMKKPYKIHKVKSVLKQLTLKIKSTVYLGLAEQEVTEPREQLLL